MKSNVAIIGVGRTLFGEHYEKDPEDLIEEAWIKASTDGIKISTKDLEAIYSSNYLLMPTNKIALPEGLLSEITGSHIPMESSKSFSSAFQMACNAIASGEQRVVLVGGVEKMTDRLDKIKDDMMMLGDSLSYNAGCTPETAHEFMLRYYLKKHNISGDSLGKFNHALALIPVKNHENATKNPNAQYPRKITVDQVLNARKEAQKPLGLYDFPPVSDGAAALILTSPELAESYTNKPVYVKSRAAATDFLTFTSRRERAGFISTQKAIECALVKSGVKIEDIGLAEICDQSSIVEMISLEDLGFSEKGKAWMDVYDSLSQSKSYQFKGRSLFVNTNGGLKADGNPLGATGGAQIYEIVRQFRGNAENQVGGLTYALNLEFEGFGTKARANIFGRD
jgi:acetyl-CoA C-acetyltransferase